MASVSSSSEHDQMRAPQQQHYGASSVRLPPVSMMPREEFLQVSQGYNPTRRVSITDPFLHAYPAATDPASSQSDSHPSQHSHQHFPSPSSSQRRPSDETQQSGYSKLGMHSPSTRLSSSGVAGAPMGGGGSSGVLSQGGDGQGNPMAPPHPHQARHGSPAVTASYEFGSSFPPGQGPPSFYHAPPPSNYRFGGPNVGPAPSQDGPSYVDYSMRRHSLSAVSGQQSPPRLPSIDASTPNTGVKRKTSLDDPIAEEGYPPPYPAATSYSGHPAYPSKRRGSSLTYDKVGNIIRGGDSRRDSVVSNSSMMQPGWDEDRRGSGGSYSSATSQGYVSSNYSIPTTVDSYDRSSGSQQGYPSHGGYQRRSGEHYSYDQLQQQQPTGPGPRGSFSVEVGPPPTHYGSSRHQSAMLPSVAHSPPDEHHNHIPFGGHRQSLPPAQAAWARAGPLPGDHSHPSSRNNSLDPTSAYGPGGSKIETPYSRSPELRVSHKLAERKRRKEMAQLFDELRDALPVDRGLKSSKWEILSKAVDYIISLKDHNSELARDNTMLRDHFGLGPGPQVSQGATSNSPPDSYRPATPSGSHTPQTQQLGNHPSSNMNSPSSAKTYPPPPPHSQSEQISERRGPPTGHPESWRPSPSQQHRPQQQPHHHHQSVPIRDQEGPYTPEDNQSPRASGIATSANGSTPIDQQSEEDLQE